MTTRQHYHAMARPIPIILCGWLLCIQHLYAKGNEHEPLAWTAPPQEHACPDTTSYLWVSHSEGRDCVRYFPSQDLTGVPTLLVVFSGDRDQSRKLPIEDIRGNTRHLRERLAKNYAKRAGIPVAVVARPGTYGSSGDHRNRRRAREFLTMNAGLSALAERYGIARFVLLGHSGGATVAAGLLTLGRTDIHCAVLTSGAFDLMERDRRRAVAQGKEPPSDDRLKRRAYFDPLYRTEGMKADSERRIYVLGNPRDKVTPYDLQKKFADAVAQAGHHVELREVAAKAPNHHDLLDRTGLNTAKECAR